MCSHSYGPPRLITLNKIFDGWCGLQFKMETKVPIFVRTPSSLCSSPHPRGDIEGPIKERFNPVRDRVQLYPLRFITHRIYL